jgi:predicted GNAT superfamily acetyltransferase
MPRFHIRILKRLEEYRGCERIQKAVWGNVGVSSEALKVTQMYGGVVLGAIATGRVVGFIYAFLARRRGRLIHWSHMMAVEPGFRDRGVGFEMKLAHRRLALSQGIFRICWTYDPLQSRNAALNITGLGARPEEYLRNCYGRFESRIERGLPSDRLVVNWRIASRAVEDRLRRQRRKPPDLNLPKANETAHDVRGFIANRKIHLHLRDPRLMIEIPPDTDAMRARAFALARRWRLEVRKIFERYLAAGYEVTDFVPPALGGGRCFYMLRRTRRK